MLNGLFRMSSARRSEINVKYISESSAHDGLPYLDFFSTLNSALGPRSYFEIGTESGHSAARYSCPSVCVDPRFVISADIVGSKRMLHLFQMTSDEFFAARYLDNLLPCGPDIAFLDGMHRFEYLLRDFINTERVAHPRTLILLHDCLPQNLRMTSRVPLAGPEEEGLSRFAWTGDVWKVIPILKKYRPELRIWFLDCPPTGLVAISGLQRESNVLNESYYQILEEFRDVDFSSDHRQQLWQYYPTLNSRALAENAHDLTLYLDIR
jgi:hypothetical protein